MNKLFHLLFAGILFGPLILAYMTDGDTRYHQVQYPSYQDFKTAYQGAAQAVRSEADMRSARPQL